MYEMKDARSLLDLDSYPFKDVGEGAELKIWYTGDNFSSFEMAFIFIMQKLRRDNMQWTYTINGCAKTIWAIRGV